MAIAATPSNMTEREITGRSEFFGQGRDAVDRLLDVALGFLKVGTAVELDRDYTAAFAGYRRNFMDVVKKPQFGFDYFDDVRFDVFGTGSGPRHGYRDCRQVEVGKELTIEPQQTEDAEYDQHRHQQVGRRGMADKDAD